MSDVREMSGKAKEKKFVKISIPKPLFEKIEKRIEGTEFTSVSGYVAHILSELLTESKEERLSEEEEKKIKARLKALGYID